MTETSTPPNMGQVAIGQPGQARHSQPTPQSRGSGSAPPSGRLAPVRKPLFRS